VGETYFFRDSRQTDLIQRHLLPASAAERHGAPVEVWSAGCSTGEEAYTLAMLAAELGMGRGVRVLGTDLSARSIARAEGGLYGTWSLRGVSDTRRRAWFVTSGASYQVRPTVREAVRFRAANLLDGTADRFDIVVCRNVLIYLTAGAVRHAAHLLRDSLRPGGWLVTGASDPPIAVPGLERVQTPDGLAYHRAVEASAARSGPPAAPRRRARPSTGQTPPPVPAPAAPASPASPGPLTTEQPETAPQQGPQQQQPPGPAPAVLARRLGDAGRRAEALVTVERAVGVDPFDAELRYLAAILHLDGGEVSAAVDAARAALYLAPDLGVAHLVLGWAQAARGQDAAAARSYRAAARELAALDPDAGVPCDGQPAGHLAAVAARLALMAGGRAG
ncbi:MAG: protein-glutamate O-methyltransferase CheR, partial [Acidimicrobiia bacterium]|nr:protein-glutamate O-methyltransferase CheR [Acidimicrobiia bacterium]